MFQCEEKMPQRERGNSCDSKGSDDSAFSSDDERELAPPYGLVFYQRKLQDKPLPALPTEGSQRRVRFELGKPLPALPGQAKIKRISSRNFREPVWWVRSRLNLSDDLEDSMEKKLD